MSWPNWNDMQLYQWLGIGGGAVALLALVLALALRKRGPVQVPAALGAALAAFAAGVGAGVVLLASFGYKWEKEPPPQVPGAAGGDPVMMQVNMAGRGGPGGRGRGRGGPGGGGGDAPSPKVQLANLVDKLDVLTRKPLAVELDGAKKKEVLEQLRGLGEQEELKDEDAQKKLDALLTVLKGDRDTLEAVGYRWPGAAAPGGGGRGPGGPAPAPPNPFKQGDNGEHLKALQQRLEKGTAG